jgi:hypothetical protein
MFQELSKICEVMPNPIGTVSRQVSPNHPENTVRPEMRMAHRQPPSINEFEHANMNEPRGHQRQCLVHVLGTSIYLQPKRFWPFDEISRSARWQQSGHNQTSEDGQSWQSG